MFCKFLKLTNGESIIATTDDECSSFKDKEFIQVTDPVQVGTIRMPRGNMIIESYVLQPWIRLAKENVVNIHVQNIVATVDLPEDAQLQYYEFIQSAGKVSFSSGDGQAAAEEMEEQLEEEQNDFLSSIFESDEEEDYGYAIRKSTRTIH
jgi:hypothetical protein